jgi:hypothetical protein
MRNLCRRTAAYHSYAEQANMVAEAGRAMTAVTKRIAKLENRFGMAEGTPQILMILSHSGWGLALDQDTCIQILDESGFLPTGPGIGIVNLLKIPMDLTAEELRKFLQEHGEETNGVRPRTD